MLSYDTVLNDLQEYVLDDTVIKKSLQMKLLGMQNEKFEKKNIKSNIKKNIEIFVPNQQDTLFWCYYIIKNGDICYESLNKTNLVAKQMKIDLVFEIRKNKDIIKTYKFDTISNIESNLANDANLNIKTFLTLCTIANINIIYVKKNTYFEQLMNDSKNIYVIHEIQNQSNYSSNKFGFELVTEEKYNNIKNTMYKVDKIDKHLKCISNYKVQELLDICNKLLIDGINKENGKHKSKKELYELINKYF